MKEDFEIEHEVYINSLIIEDKEGNLTAELKDVEGDEFVCEFDNDDSIKINTDGLEYITLSVDDLFTMIDLIERAKEIYDNDSLK